MTAQGILFAVIVLLCALFALFNWEAVTFARPVNLLLAQVPLPLGLVLLIAIALLSALYSLLSLVSRARHLALVNDYEHRLESMRDELDRARFEELGGLEKRLGERIGHLEKRVVTSSEGLEEELRRTQRHLDERVLLLRNELAADIAQLSDSPRRGRPDDR